MNYFYNLLPILVTLILFIFSSIRHLLFQSGAFDLGIFDQAVYLISIGKVPISSLIGFHILGDHGAWILYPLALLYKIYPSVYWLLAVQAVALAFAGLFVWQLARDAGLAEKSALTMAGVYWLYPLVFNLNLFDFHPEVIAMPAFFGAVLAARRRLLAWFCLAILIILGCKAVLALTVAAMGIWLLFFENRPRYGTIAISVGIAWFLIATNVLIPAFGNEAASVARHLPRYEYLGSSITEVLTNLLLQPALVFGKVFSLPTLEYLGLLILPVIWGLSPAHLSPLIGALPTLILNILSESSSQRNLIHQYSLPILPFLLLAVISYLATNPSPKKLKFKPTFIISWAFISFLALAKYGYFGTIYLDSLATWQATQKAISLIQTPGNVLTTHEIVPHLSHRELIDFTKANTPPADLQNYDYILLNARHAGWQSSPEFAQTLINQLQNSSDFQLSYQRDEVYLFQMANR